MTKNGRKPKLTRKSGNHLGELNHNRTYNIGEYAIHNESEMVITTDHTRCGFAFTLPSTNLRDLCKEKLNTRGKLWVVYSADQYIEKSLSTSTSFAKKKKRKKKSDKKENSKQQQNPATRNPNGQFK